MCRYGCPEVLITDQGREFVNEISSQLYAITKTEHRITSAYHPQVYLYYYAVMVEFNKFYIPILQTNGLTERFNQTLSRCLAKIIDEDKLDTVLMGYRASQQASTKQSPYFMMFQQQMRLPIDAEILPESCTPALFSACLLTGKKECTPTLLLSRVLLILERKSVPLHSSLPAY